MAEGKQPTIEELQEQLVALQEKQKEQEVQIQALNSEKETLSADLNKARELNTKLFLKIPQGGVDGSPQPEPKEEDSFDKLLDEIIEKRILSKNKETK